MDKLKRLLHENIYLYDFALQRSFGQYNKSMETFIESISKIDPIGDYEAFREKMKEIPALPYNDIYAIRRAYGENTLYGHAYNLLEYAGLDRKDIFYTPILEHGIPYSSQFDGTKYKLNNAYIFQGKNNSEAWEREKKQKAYYIGPYIHYCEGIYDAKTIESIKSKNGLTALVFLPHSIETNQFKVDISRVLEEFKKATGSDIKTIIACVYCMDAPNIEEPSDDNIHFVSAGFKLDHNFIRRLRTIMELADVVYYSSFSSSIGYAYYLQKRIICNPTERDYEELGKLVDVTAVEKLKTLHELFGIDAVVDKKAQRSFINQYWGIDEIKSPDEIRCIVDENKRRIKRRLGF